MFAFVLFLLVPARADFLPFTFPEVGTFEAVLPFPQWLKDITHLSEWPGMDPPYIPLDFVQLDQVPSGLDSWVHVQSSCGSDMNNDKVCSFDCYNCVAPDDIYTCSSLSQTFDDGPTPFTMDLVDTLTTPITFFTIGINVVRYPQVYRDTASRGHVMASHTWSHKFLPSLTNEEIVAQLQWCMWAMNATHGHLPKWFRPPYGGVDNRVRSIIRQFGMQSVLWDFDTFDWQIASSKGEMSDEELYPAIERFQQTNQGRGLILEHDSSAQSVEIGKKVFAQLGLDQKTVAQCADGVDYLKAFVNVHS